MTIPSTTGRACSKYILSLASKRSVTAFSLRHTHLPLPASKLAPAFQRSSFATTSHLFQFVTDPSEDPRASTCSSSSPSNKNANPSIPVTSGTQARRIAQNNQARAASATANTVNTRAQDLTFGLDDAPLVADESGGSEGQVDWSRSFHGLSSTAFPAEAVKILNEPLDTEDIEIKPDGLLYLPEIKYRRILNRAFGPGAWGLAPRGPTIVTAKNVTREYGMVVQGRLVSIARGEQAYFDAENIPTATEGCKSNALMRCCKDLGIASELWDPRFIRKFIAENVRETWVEHVGTGKRRKMFMRNGDKVQYPFKEANIGNSASGVRSGASMGRSAGQR